MSFYARKSFFLFSSFFLFEPETPWVLGQPWSDMRDLWRHWWKGLANPSVHEGPRCWECLPPLKTKNHEDKARKYGKLNGALPRDNPLGH